MDCRYRLIFGSSVAYRAPHLHSGWPKVTAMDAPGCLHAVCGFTRHDIEARRRILAQSSTGLIARAVCHRCSFFYRSIIILNFGLSNCKVRQRRTSFAPASSPLFRRTPGVTSMIPACAALLHAVLHAVDSPGLPEIHAEFSTGSRFNIGFFACGAHLSVKKIKSICLRTRN